MERPKVTNVPKNRDVTAEIVYLDEMRRNGNGYGDGFASLSDEMVDRYQTEADAFVSQNKRPEIMDLYDEYDGHLTDTEASCIALADELLALKDENSPLTFVDVCVDKPAADVLATLHSMKVGELLSSDDEQLAIESDGEYYPVLDMRKENAELVGVGLRVWGWNYDKYTFTDNDDASRNPRQNLLVYPADETLAERQIEIAFSYVSRQPANDGSTSFNETISLVTNNHGDSSFSKSISAMAYAETGYEGHNHAALRNVAESDIAAFGDLVAEIVGDEPESIGARQNRKLAEVKDGAVSQSAKNVIQALIDATWPAQASFILSHRYKNSEKTLAQMLQSDTDADYAVEAVQSFIAKWQKN